MSERDIFIAALEIENPDQRAAWLEQACDGDANLRRRVDVLLRVHDQAGEALDDPIVARLAAAAVEPGATTFTASPPQDRDDLKLDFLTPADKPEHLGKLGAYSVMGVVGRGGMGVVLKAFDSDLHRVVAIKVMAPHLAASPAARRRFEREARAVAAIRNEHVVAIHAIEHESSPPFLVMEYIAGISLDERLKQAGPLDLKETLRIAHQIARGLAAAHAEGLIHRDIKPANILLENGVERVKITDFGLARAADDANLTQTGVITGTPNYMSPEQADGKPIDYRSDLFSLGSVIYAMCAGHPPFRADRVAAVLKRVANDTPRPLREINSDVPDWLEAIVQKLHAKDPDDRFQSAAEVADLLGQHLAHLQQPAVFEAPPPVQVPVLDEVEVVSEPEKRSSPPPWHPSPWQSISSVLLVLILLASFSRTLIGQLFSIEHLPSRIVVIVGICLAIILTVRMIRHFVAGRWLAGGLEASAIVLSLAAIGVAIHQPLSFNIGQPSGSVGWSIAALVTIALVGILAAAAELMPSTARRQKPALKPVGWSLLNWLIPLLSMLPLLGFAVRTFWNLPAVRTTFPGIGTALIIKWYDPERDLTVKYADAKSEFLISNRNVTPLNGPAEASRQVRSGQYWVRAYRDSKLIYEQAVSVADQEQSVVEIPHLPPGEPTEWKSLFDGQSLAGWDKAASRGEWSADNGLLVGRGGYLFSVPNQFENFHLFAEVQLNDGGDGGLFFRCSPGKHESPDGWEADLSSPNNTAQFGRLIRHDQGDIDVTTTRPIGRPGDWLGVEILARSEMIVTKVNGKIASKRLDMNSRFPRGSLALEALGPTELRIRQIKIREFPAGPMPLTADAPFPADTARWYQKHWAGQLKSEVVETNGIGMKMTLIPPGEFKMGVSAEDFAELTMEWQAILKQAPNPNPWRTWEFASIQAESPQHTVRITRPFYVSAHEITVAQFREFVKATGYKTQAETSGKGSHAWNRVGAWLLQPDIDWRNPSRDWKAADDQPVVHITRGDAERFCAWLNLREGGFYRLPTEAEWEYACRAGAEERYSFGNSAAEISRFGWSIESGVDGPQPVGKKRPNPWGLFDMHGNVQEWCADGFAMNSYTPMPASDPTGPPARSLNVIRGGGWSNHAIMCRSSARHFARPDDRSDHTGFRVVREITSDAGLSGDKLISRIALSMPTITQLPVVRLDQGGWRIETTRAGIVELFDIAEPPVTEGKLIVRANVKTGSSEAAPSLQIRCQVDGRQIEASNAGRSVAAPAGGWKTLEAAIRIDAGQKLTRLQVNVGIGAKATIWIKDVEIRRGGPSGKKK